MRASELRNRAIGGIGRILDTLAVSQAVQRSPLPPQITARLYWTVAPHIYRHQYPTDFSHSSDPDPFKIIPIDPIRIERFTGRRYPPWYGRRQLFGAVRSGDWDCRRHEDVLHEGGPPEELFHADYIDDTPLFQAIYDRFREGVPWADTWFINRAIELLDAGQYPVWQDCETETDVYRRCEALESVYENMAQNGCLHYTERTEPIERSFDYVGAREQEIVVDIGRDGAPLLVSGKHRLCLARVLKLDTVPCCVLVRHADWMATRRAVAEGRRRPWTHPDLLDLSPGRGRSGYHS